jgi:hypothetical protein
MPRSAQRPSERSRSRADASAVPDYAAHGCCGRPPGARTPALQTPPSAARRESHEQHRGLPLAFPASRLAPSVSSGVGRAGPAKTRPGDARLRVSRFPQVRSAAQTGPLLAQATAHRSTRKRPRRYGVAVMRLTLQSPQFRRKTRARSEVSGTCSPQLGTPRSLAWAKCRPPGVSSVRAGSAGHSGSLRANRLWTR